jgi:hypothetical protein
MREEIQEACKPILHFLSKNKISSTLSTDLAQEFPKDSTQLQNIESLCKKALAENLIKMRGAPELRFGRILKPTEACPVSIDIVDMNCKGPGHTHPLGEVDLCFPQDPGAEFDGNADTWIVYPERSWHEPTVSKGRMIILYFLPEGSIRFETNPSV